MEQFILEKYLENQSRKIMTREGKNVEIIHTNSPVPHHPIVGFIDRSIYTWTIDGKLIYGKEEQDKNDLFFADEEDGLTEFEKELQIIISEASHWTSDDGSTSIYCQFGDKEIKKISGQILDLARKEILKDLPKWKTYKGELIGTGLSFKDNGNLVLVRKGYYIDVNEHDKLPKGK